MSRVCFVVCLVALAGCVSPEAPVDPIWFDPCETVALVPGPTATAEETDSIREAAAMWNAEAGTRLVVQAEPDADARVIPVRFEDAAPVFYGVYEPDDGAVIINHRLEGEVARTITVAHELGHAFALEHVEGRVSLMNPGNLEIPITDGDVGELWALWGDCPGLQRAP